MGIGRFEDVDLIFRQECNITNDIRKMGFGELEWNRVDLITDFQKDTNFYEQAYHCQLP